MLILSLERSIVNTLDKTPTTLFPIIRKSSNIFYGKVSAAAKINKPKDINDEDKARIQALVQELDQLVPRTDAVVVMSVYGGGCDESRITATENGYLRIGIELLKAPFAPRLGAGEDARVDVNLEALVSEQSDINFHLFHLNNTLTPNAAPAALQARQPWQDKVIGTICGLVCLLLYVMAVGFVTIGSWLSKL